MQQEDFDKFPASILKELYPEGTTIATKAATKAVIENKLKELENTGSLLVLTTDEVDCLMAYRVWKSSNAYGSRVFYWRKN